MDKLGKPKNIKDKLCTGEGRKKMKKEENEKSFEELMESLEEIVRTLEKGDLNLDKSVEKFEEGMKISKKCNEILENSEKRISILLENNGEMKEEDFNI